MATSGTPDSPKRARICEVALLSRTSAETSVHGLERSKPVTTIGTSSKPAWGTSVPSSLAV